MGGVLIGFAIIAVVILTGYVIARFGVIGPEAHQVLSRLAFFVLSPALLFTVLAEADLHALFSRQLPIAAIAAVVPMAIFLAVALAVWRRKVPEATIGALASGYLNANNIGIPVAAYVVGDAAASAPVILLQLIVFAPVALTVLDVTTSGKASLGRILSQPLRNPLIVGSVLGLVVALTGVELPAPVLAPFELVGAAAVPIILINFGMSLHGRRLLEHPGSRRDVVLAVVLKLVLMPLVAWAAARFLFGLEGHALFVAVVLAALPTAQNVFNYATRYRRGETLARDAVLLSTLLSLPVIVLVAALLFA
ncbi:AEC family transporter [Protaetiibacter mangrovi]|uniref:AEC family transporter n=1 Tax=Protaetiibacter mangrovi TaxID=2970926 RepID=A0ABT1ZCG4_9MICO|nr:AEC family transporter [Protaetiibacter mangrovi]MCS0498392.1 AEC family transporter [Protaetiibacter mangrovi]TPX02894.1 AEC family transporter [Schumannella luteola]